ncbi:hypothetical protein SDJN02_01379, partial [Cucurbita argyrosperma subsp. argyrosperma]
MGIAISSSMRLHTQILSFTGLHFLESEDGDIIDCVDIYKQPAFDHPALKNHTIQMEPDWGVDWKMSVEQNEPFQVWQRSGRCPEGTIPIRRVREQDLLRVNSLDSFGKNFFYGSSKLGAEVNRSVDSYKSIGCFDLTCSGFVQTNHKVVLGAVIDRICQRWTTIHYLCRTTLVEWGGEVFSSHVKKVPHTGTAMGSGDYARRHYRHASYVILPRIVDNSLQLKYPERVGTWANEPFCYSADNYQRTYTTEPVFFYGGPGRSCDCH